MEKATRLLAHTALAIDIINILRSFRNRKTLGQTFGDCRLVRRSGLIFAIFQKCLRFYPAGWSRMVQSSAHYCLLSLKIALCEYLSMKPTQRVGLDVEKSLEVQVPMMKAAKKSIEAGTELKWVPCSGNGGGGYGGGWVPCSSADLSKGFICGVFVKKCRNHAWTRQQKCLDKALQTLG